MRILHTSDWHLGRQFHNVSLLEDQAVVLEQIVDIVKHQAVDVVLVAGDIYDRSVPPADAVTLLDDVLERICLGLKTPVIMIAGNHDGPKRLGFASRHLVHTGLFITGSLVHDYRPVILNDKAGDVAFYSVPYSDPTTVRHFYGTDVSTHDEAMGCVLSHLSDNCDSGTRRVVLSHVFLAGAQPSDSERPLSIGGLDMVSAEKYRGFNYAALGHLHGSQARGSETIRYSGSILKYSFSEVHHRKSVTLVEMDGDGNCTIEQVPLTPKRDLRILEGQLEEILARGQSDPDKEDYLLVRLTDTHAILDIMSKLREVYPNVLHLERPGLMASAEQTVTLRDHLRRNELTMFDDFYQQVVGEKLSPEQTTVLEELLKSIHEGERT